MVRCVRSRSGLQDKFPTDGSRVLGGQTRLARRLTYADTAARGRNLINFFLRPAMALNIKDPETDRLARRLSMLTGESITMAVKTAVRERIEREERTRGKASYE